MKKATFTLHRPRCWMSLWAQSAFLVLFSWCCISIGDMTAQSATVVMPSDGSSLTHTIDACTGTVNDTGVAFTDDDAGDATLYSDFDLDNGAPTTVGRTDTVAFCPQDQWHRVQVIFTKFELAPNDVLTVFQGDIASLNDGNNTGNMFATATGAGVANAFGGWVDANCRPNDNATGNPSGCLTFVFTTTADNFKGTGWEAWVGCADRGIEIDATIDNAKLNCPDTLATLRLPAPEFTASCDQGLGFQPYKVELRNSSNDLCYSDTIDAIVNANNPEQIQLGIGVYSVTYTMIADPTKNVTKNFAVSGPSLVCNDEVNIALNSGCGFELAPDDLLENPCPVTEVMQYKIIVNLGEGKDAVTVEGVTEPPGMVVTGSGAAADFGSAPIVWVTKEQLAAANIGECGGSASVTIERTWYPNGLAIANTPRNDVETCAATPFTESCTTTINFTDQTPPIVQFSSDIDTLVSCDTTGLSAALGMTGFDNCDDDVDVSFSAVLEETDPCMDSGGMFGADTTRVFLTFTATDNCGNSSQGRDTVILLRPTEFVFPTNLTLECTDGDTLGFVGVEVGFKNADGFTPTDTIELSTEDYICGYILTPPQIVPIAGNDCGRKQIVNGSILDWCDPNGAPQPYAQVLNFTDSEAPSFDGDADDLTISVGNTSCTVDGTSIASPSASDNCDGDPTIRIIGIDRIEDGETWPVPSSGWASLDCDSFSISWAVADDCHEQPLEDTISQVIVVVDDIQPNAICRDQLNITLGSGGVAFVTAASINAGSSDNCGIASSLVRVAGSDDDFTESIEVSCDLKPGTQIELLITDDKGNTNVCWGELQIEDKIGPSISAPADAQGSCVDYHQNVFGEGGVLEPGGDIMMLLNGDFGTPTTSDNCGVVGVAQSIAIEPGDCGGFIITRAFEVEDWGGLTAVDTQVISIVSDPDWKLTFPADVTIDCGDDVPDAASVDAILTEVGFCDRLSVSVDEQMFTGSSDACIKIVRTYTVWNSCGTDGDYNVNTSAGESLMVTNDSTTATRIVYVQTITAEVTEGPEIVIGDIHDLGIRGSGDKDNPTACGELKEFEVWAGDCLGNDIPESGMTVVITGPGGDTLKTENDFSTFADDQDFLTLTGVVEPGTYTWFYNTCQG